MTPTVHYDELGIDRQVAVVRENAWFIRLYCWMWGADKREITFCRLFWGYVFALPNLLIRAFVMPAWWVIGRIGWGCGFLVDYGIRFFAWLGSKLPESKAEYTPMPSWKRSPAMEGGEEKKPRRNRAHRILDFLAAAGDRGLDNLQRAWPYLRWCFIVIGVVLGACVGILTGLGLYALATQFSTVANAVAIAATWAGEGLWFLRGYIAVALLLAFVLFVAVMVGRALGRRPGVQRAADRGADRAMGFGRAMFHGAKSAKYRTCPIIRVVDE